MPIYTVLEQSWRHFTSLKLCKCSQIPPRIQNSIKPQQKPTSIGLIVYKYSLTHTQTDRQTYRQTDTHTHTHTHARTHARAAL